MTIKFMRKLSILLLALVAADCLCGFGAAAEETGYKDTDFVIAYARDGQSNEARDTSWDRNIPFPGDDFSKTNEAVSTNVLNDSSAEHPAEAYRELNEINGGLVTVDFDFSMDRPMETSYRLADGKTTLFGITTKNNGIYLQQPENELLYLMPYSTSYVTGEFTYVVKAVIDFDSQRIVSVQINGKTYAQDKPYANPVTKANGFYISTSRESVGVLTNRRLFISGGYYIYECFWNADGNLPDDWKVLSSGGNASVKAAALRYPDKYSLMLDSQNGDIEYSKAISPLGGNVVYEINTFQEAKRDGFYIGLTDGGKTAAEITSDGKSFCYVDENGSLCPFYDYTDNVWYNIRLELNHDNLTYDIYINYKLRESGVKLLTQGKSVDGAYIKSLKNSYSLSIDDIKLYRKRIYGDYVSAPQPQEKKDKDTLVCMQMCPLWTEGTHYGWDRIKAASNNREPLLGYYDEFNPEVYDWYTKWMVEHGVDFQFQCVYPTARINYDVPDAPIKCDTVREYNGIMEGFMNSRYSNQMKFAVILECTTFFHGYGHYNEFFDYYLPFYIEYYLKDDRYMKIDSRPVIGVFALKSFLNIFDDGTGTESIRKGIKRMRKMCIDAGVGDPYILSNESTGSNIIKLASEAGLDGITAYGLGDDATFATQRINMLSTAEECKSAGIDFWPIATPMRNDIAWRIYSGYTHSGEEFSEHLAWIKNNITDKQSPSVSKKVVNMTTWDEYGEGHIIAPTVGLGFEYLDAIRENYVKAGEEHNEEYPTEEQKKRVDMLYVQDRKTTFTKIVTEDAPTDTRIIQGKREYDKPAGIPETVKLKLDFKTAGDVAKCTAGWGAEKIQRTANGIAVTLNDRSPSIFINDPINMDSYDVTYAKIRMKKNPTSGGGWLSWTSDISPGFSTEKKVYFNPGTDDGSEFKDYYIPVGESAFWKGKIEQLKITLGDTSDSSLPFEVESLEFLSDNALANAQKINIDGWIQNTGNDIEVKSGSAAVPMRQILLSAGADYIQCFESTDTYSIKYNDVYSEITLGDKKAETGGRKLTLPFAAYKVSDRTNDEVMVPVEFIEAVLSDKKVSWENSEKTLYVTTSESGGGANGVIRKTVDSLEFDSAERADKAYGLDAIKCENGEYKAVTTTADPQMYFKTNLKAEDVKIIEVKINTAASQKLNFFFITDKDKSWDEYKRSPSYTTSPGDNIIRFDTGKDLVNWKNTIKEVRFDPSEESGDSFSIDYIRFYGDEEKPDGRIKDMSSCITKSEDGLEWQFGKNTYLDGWEANKFFGSVKTADGMLNAVITGRKPLLVSRSDINEECGNISVIKISYANNTMSNKLKIYFMTDGMNVISEECSFTAEIVPMESECREYIINTSGNAHWKGTLKKLVIAPAENAKGNISVDSIKLQYANRQEG